MKRLSEVELFDTGPDDLLTEKEPPRKPSRAPWVLLLLVLAGSGGGAGWLFWQLRDARAELDRSRAERRDAEARLAAEKAEKEALVAAKDALAEDVERRDEELARLRGDLGELEEKMKAEIEKGNIRLSEEKGRIKVDMVDEILFDVGDSSISDEGVGVLSRVGAVLAKMKDKHIQVSGHTDDVPISSRLVDRFPTNWELSAARAITVVRFLEEKAGIPGARLVAAAHSQYDPIASNRGAGRGRNRRIEILLTPELDPDRAAALRAAAPPPPAPARAVKPAIAKPAAKASPAKTAKTPAVKGGAKRSTKATAVAGSRTASPGRKPAPTR
jgi:chemotaxis protein MotB